MECSGSQDAKELVRSPPSGQARGERSGQRPSRPLRLGGLSFEHVCAAENAVSESSLHIRVVSLFKSLSAGCPAHGTCSFMANVLLSCHRESS